MLKNMIENNEYMLDILQIEVVLNRTNLHDEIKYLSTSKNRYIDVLYLTLFDIGLYVHILCMYNIVNRNLAHFQSHILKKCTILMIDRNKRNNQKIPASRKTKCCRVL